VFSVKCLVFSVKSLGSFFLVQGLGCRGEGFSGRVEARDATDESTDESISAMCACHTVQHEPFIKRHASNFRALCGANLVTYHLTNQP